MCGAHVFQKISAKNKTKNEFCVYRVQKLTAPTFNSVITCTNKTVLDVLCPCKIKGEFVLDSIN